ncbi:hypothetical protein AAHE18_17G217700 [Arachis hypogaea]
MSRITKWKVEKTKVKVVFRLQFHATHIPQSGWDKLYISFIPAETGKATSKTTKANVRNGACKWSDPIYETTRLLQDIRTKQYEEKLYKLVVGMGSSRSSILGEATINLADFVDALKPTSLALPLNGSDPGPTLHVTVQLLTSKTGFREFEQQRELTERGLRATSDQGSHEESADGKDSSPDQNVNNHMHKVNSRLKLKRESKDIPRISSLERESGVNEDYADLAAGYDGSSTTSESAYTEKHDVSSTHEIDSLKSMVSGDLVGQSSQPEKRDAPDGQVPSQGSHWVHGWSADYSASDNLTAPSEVNSSLKGNLGAVESSILDLKLTVSSLQNHADEIGVETHKFSKQLSAEISSGEALAKEVAVLKSECSKFKDEIEQLKSSKLSLLHGLRDLRETGREKFFQKLPLKCLKGLLLMEDKVRAIQKASMGFPERDFRLLNLELESLLEILRDLKQESREPISEADVANERENKKMDLQKGEQYLTDIGSDVGLFQPEGMAHYLTIPGIMSHEADPVDPTIAMKAKIFELLRELDDSKTEREGLIRKMEQMECYYEALVQELEQSQRQLMAELQNLRNEHSTCIYTIAASKDEMEIMHRNMNEQIMNFSEDKRILESISSEFEKRALSAEAALKRARLNYSIAVGQLQKDLELLSCQVLSMHETNENLIKQTLSDSPLPDTDGFREPVKYLNNSEGHISNLPSQNHSSSLNRQHFGEDILLSDLKRSLKAQEDLYKQVEEEICQMHFANIYSDVFSKALQETLLEASCDIRILKEEVLQLSQQLQVSNESNELLVLRLQNAMNDILSLNEYKEICTAKSNDVAHQNQILQVNLNDLSHENSLLTQKINELDVLLKESRSYEGKYMACTTENSEIRSMLKKESLENGHLREEISILHGELEAVRNKFDEMASLKDNLRKNVSFLSNKLQKLLASYDDTFSEISFRGTSDSECKELEGILLRLEEVQQRTRDRILLLIEEKQVLVDEKHSVQVSLNAAESDVLVMKQKFEHDLNEMLRKITESSARLQKLKIDFEVIVNRINAGFGFEETFSQHHKEFLSSRDHLEAEVQQLNSRNQELAQEILKLDTLSSDLELCKLTLAHVTEEKKALELSLQDKTEVYVKISSELDFSKESLHSLHNELHTEKMLREKLGKEVANLTAELNDKQCQLQDSDMTRQEMIHLKQLVADLEFEKSRISDLLQESEERLELALKESSSFTSLATHFSELHEFSIATDVVATFTRAQLADHVVELSEKLHSASQQLDILHKKNLDVESELNSCLCRELTCIEENKRLQTSLDSLKSELDATSAQKRALIDQNDAMISELEEHKSRTENVNNTFIHESQLVLEVERLGNLLECSSGDGEELFLLKEEAELKCLVLQAKLHELETAMTSLKDGELVRLENQCNELSKRLSEQVLKTEEFKNLSLHLKELKDKAEAECHNARERRGNEGPPVAMQESLRIAFIKEQYETKLQELKQQLSLSKKHSEEMLWKLQDAIEELESRKKSEASCIKLNEELGTKILELEAELQAVISDKRNLSNTFDLVKAEKECSLISLECCKQEKQELEASLLKSNEERSKIEVELTSAKQLLESLRSDVREKSNHTASSRELESTK